MTPPRVEASRGAEVRAAARGWRASGAIDDATLARIEAAYPEDRHRMAMAWKILVFVIVTIAANALFFAIATMIRDESGPEPWLVFAAVLAAATEMLLHRSRIGENGSAAATSFWAALYATVGVGLGLDHGGGGWEGALTAALLAAAVAFAAAGWRWGYAAEVAIGALAFFLFLARLPGGRWWWILAGLAVAAVAWPGRTRRSLPPPMRGAASAVVVVAMAAIYAAVNRYSVDQHAVETMARGGSFSTAPASGVFAALSTLATAVLPLALICWGLRRRQTLALDLGIVSAAISLVTLRYYVHLAPLWALLTAAGVVLVVGSLRTGRWLREGPEGERGGFTARPLTERRPGLETAAIAVAFAPEARPAPAPEPGGFTPGGGRYGGGGATGEF
jgi:hypothetical protein